MARYELAVPDVWAGALGSKLVPVDTFEKKNSSTFCDCRADLGHTKVKQRRAQCVVKTPVVFNASSGTGCGADSWVRMLGFGHAVVALSASFKDKYLNDELVKAKGEDGLNPRYGAGDCSRSFDEEGSKL